MLTGFEQTHPVLCLCQLMPTTANLLEQLLGLRARIDQLFEGVQRTATSSLRLMAGLIDSRGPRVRKEFAVLAASVCAGCSIDSPVRGSEPRAF